MPTIDRYYFTACLGGVVRDGHAVEPLLKASGVAPSALLKPSWRGDVGQMADLVRQIVVLLQDEQMGFTAHPVPLGAFAFAAELAWQGPSVREGLERAIRFYNLVGRGIATTIESQDNAVVVSARFAEPALDPGHYFHEFWMIIWHRLACWLAGETVTILRAEFDYARPDYFEEFRHLFPCEHGFEAPRCAIWLETRALSGPIRRSRGEVDAMIAVAPLDIMTIPASDSSVGRRVRTLLARYRSHALRPICLQAQASAP